MSLGISPCVCFSPSCSFSPPLPGTIGNPKLITTARRITPTGFFFALRSHHPACRLSFLVGQSIPPSAWAPSFLVTGHWSLVTSDLSLGDQVPHRTPNVHPRYLHSTSGYDIPCLTPLHPVQDPPDRAPCAPRGPRSHGAVFQDSHMPYGIRNSESQNRGKAISHGAVFSLLTT